MCRFKETSPRAADCAGCSFLVFSFPSRPVMSHLSSLMDDVDVEQGRVKETIPQRTQQSSSDSFFGRSRLTCFCSPHFIRCLLRSSFSVRLHVCLLDCGSATAKLIQRVYTRVCLFFYVWQLCDFFPYCQILDLVVLSLFMTFLPLSQFVISSKCRNQIVLQITAQGLLQNVSERHFWKCIILQIIFERTIQLSKIVKMLVEKQIEDFFFFFFFQIWPRISNDPHCGI